MDGTHSQFILVPGCDVSVVSTWKLLLSICHCEPNNAHLAEGPHGFVDKHESREHAHRGQLDGAVPRGHEKSPQGLEERQYENLAVQGWGHEETPGSGLDEG